MQQFAPDEVEMRETIRDQRAEIAKLKSDLTKAHQDGYAEGRKHRVAAVETHADEMYRAQEEIAKLRVDLDQARRDRNSAVECAEVLRGYVAAHKADLAAARAALAAERDACDEAQRALNLGIEFAFDASDGRPGIDTACEVIANHDARRSAESKCDGCDSTRARCDEAKAGGAIKCCPDCDHRAAEAKE